MIEIHSKLSRPKESEVYSTYWKFAGERQNIFFNRINNELRWTNDEILIKHKFTNAYRASDRVSQYLIKNVIYNHSFEPKETLFRLLLFKTFNKIETWELLLNRMGNISYREFNFALYDEILSALLNNGTSIYSGAYIMTSGRSIFGYSKKHRNHLKLIEFMIEDDLAEKVMQSQSLESLFNLLKEYPTIGNFLAYQYAIDINYSNLVDFDEMDFVFPGPGALDGIKKCFTDTGEYSDSDIIKYVTENQELEFQRNDINFKNLWGRPLQLIDCQNLFCEVDKYARVAHPNVLGISGRSRIKQIFKPKNKEIEYWYPPKWNINENINK
ncbi:nucleotide kinase domain-containing protein [Flavivirga spongiicola]|uniref:DNA base hypermodification protein n=1 Tax=Flavivirga spongiicola TaxID=421621 RepID=A0ABU7XZP1_9FLAO|nr:nucleotide kinase domain-containing protein [Flavivirga sp. MEBiC05379]MDO5980900.1 putative DNA base hypermodification protein [Flavivirga sp. MEBiC05379]